MGLKDIDNVTYFRLNNEINRPINGTIPLHKDQEALKAFFIENVEPFTKKFGNLSEKLAYLVDHNYIDEALLELYSEEFIKKLHDYLTNAGFKFKSFMSAYKFYQQYALKTNDGQYYLENIEERMMYNALFLANGDEQLAWDIATELVNQRYQPATPTFLNAGRKQRGEYISCFLLNVDDCMNSIGRSINSALQLSKNGGGVGLCLSNLREAGAPIKGYENASSGVIPVMKLYEDSFSYANQLGQRQGAGAVYLSVFHPDIISFLSTKKENADEKIRVKTLSLGIVVPDKFYELVRKDEDMYLFSPYSVERELGMQFAYVDITKHYDDLVKNPNIVKTKIRARALEEEISKLQQESGYPYILNVDIANRANPTDGTIIMSNLCSEILQPQTPSVINADQQYKQLGMDISCNLGSMNMINLMKAKDLGKSIRIAMRALTHITDSSNIEEVPTVRNGNNLMRTTGLGLMGLASYFATNQVHYGSKESLEITSTIFMLMNYWSLVESNNVARERNHKFYNFEKSEYYTGTYFDKYITNDYSPKSEKVKELFKGHFIPTKNDWEKLKTNIREHGLYHSHRLAVAPNGSISYINDCSSSIHPVVQRIEERQEKKIGKIYYPAYGLSSESIPYYVSAYDINMTKVIDVYAKATEHVDQGLSLTLFIRSEIPEGLYEWKTSKKQTTRDLSILRNYAFNKGIKTIYYIRTFTDDGEEVGANQCESCTI